MKIGLIISVLLALLGVAIWWAVHAWTSLGEVECVHNTGKRLSLDLSNAKRS